MHHPPKRCDAAFDTFSTSSIKLNSTTKRRRRKKKVVAKHRLQARLSRLPSADKGLCNPFIQTSLYSSRPELTAVWDRTSPQMSSRRACSLCALSRLEINKRINQMVTSAECIRDEAPFPRESRTSEKTASTLVFSTMIWIFFVCVRVAVGWVCFSDCLNTNTV